jgi:hypothetical protein
LTGAQVPFVALVFAAAQAWHVPAQGESQQNPSTQLLDWHCEDSVHTLPLPWSD